MYNCDNDAAEFLYFDETLQTPEEGGHGESFYAMTAAKYRKSDLEVLRGDLIAIVGDDLFREKNQPYWHATEALRTSAGEKVFEEMLGYLSENEDVSFITCKTPVPKASQQEHVDGRKTVSPSENARRECLRKMFEEFADSFQQVEGLVFEARKSQEENDRDKSFLKKLKREGALPNGSNNAWVSPSSEVALWVPDTVSMAYRRTRTHTGRTSNYFFDYLDAITEVREF